MIVLPWTLQGGCLSSCGSLVTERTSVFASTINSYFKQKLLVCFLTRSFYVRPVFRHSDYQNTMTLSFTHCNNIHFFFFFGTKMSFNGDKIFVIMGHVHVWTVLNTPSHLHHVPPTYPDRTGLRGDVAIDCRNNLYQSLKCKCVYQVGLWCRSSNTQWGTIVNQTFARRPIERATLTPHNETHNWNGSSSNGQNKFPSLSQHAWKRAVLSDVKQCRISKGTLISCP